MIDKILESIDWLIEFFTNPKVFLPTKEIRVLFLMLLPVYVMAGVLFWTIALISLAVIYPCILVYDFIQE